MRIRTGFSFRTAFGHLEDVMDRLIEIGFKVAPISDRMSTFGYVRWTKLAKKKGMRPIYGVELAVVPTQEAKKPIIDYWTFFAKSSLRPLHDLIALATEGTRKEPTLLYSQALKVKGLIKITGERVLLDHVAPFEDLFIGLSPSLPKGQFKAAKDAGHRFIATSDNYYPTEDQKELYRIALGKRANTQTYPMHILSPQEWSESVEWFTTEEERAEAWGNLSRATGACRAELKRAELLTPKKDKTLKALCVDGARTLGVDLKDKVYKERLERELTLISDKKFEDYFYIIADMINYAKKEMIVGPARGSSCGSLVCYLLGITAVDPIPFGLIFERFIDVNRTDLPDIDIDFSDARRDKVFEYIEKKYGAGHVARLGTVMLFKPRSVLKSAGASLRIPSWKLEKVADGLIERSGGDSRALQALEDTLSSTEAGRRLLHDHPEFEIANRMEGHPNSSSQHAAGIVVTKKPVAEYVAVDSRNNSAMCDKKDAEELNLLKIDALGLTQLSIFERTLELIGEESNSKYLEKLPLDDQKAFNVLNEGKFAGIFQFNGIALQSLTRQITVEHIEDIISVTALARPGPLATGGSASWVKRRVGKEKIDTLHPMLTELTRDTYGITIYQEQVMNIVRHLGKMSWEDTSAVRKAMSGRLGDEFFEQFWLKFRKGALENKIEEGVAKAIWDQINTFGCISGSTAIELPLGNQYTPKSITLEELFNNSGVGKVATDSGNRSAQKNRKAKIWNWHGSEIKTASLIEVTESGIKKTWELTTVDGHALRATPDHLIQTTKGWKALKSIKPNDEVMVLGPKLPPRDFKGTGSGAHNKRNGHSKLFLERIAVLKKKFKLCQVCKCRPYQETHHKDKNRENNDWENLLPVCRVCHKSFHDDEKGFPQSRGRQIAFSKVISNRPWGKEMTYDIAMPKPHNNFLANQIVVHNSWAFNRSHAVAYGLVSYWCCWLKAHFPLEFAAASLDAESDPIKQISLLRELSAEGISYIAVDPELSTDKWVIDPERGKLIGPLTSIKGLGPASVSEIMTCRERGEPVREALAKRLKSARTDIDSLFPVRDAVKRLFPDLRDANIVSEPFPINIVQQGISGDVLIIGIPKKIAPRDENDSANVAKRGYEYKGPTWALNLFVYDDTDEIFCKIDRFNFDRLAQNVIKTGRPGKSIYAIKGTVPEDFRMVRVKNIRYLGDLDPDYTGEEE
jgi:DNA polymerase III alpha subunit